MELGFPGGVSGKESAFSAGDTGLIPVSGRSLGGEHGNPVEYACLKNPHGKKSSGRLRSMGWQRVGHD